MFAASHYWKAIDRWLTTLLMTAIRAAERASRLADAPGRLWVVAFLFFSAYCVLAGPRLSPDSYTYSAWADALIAARFNFAEFVGMRREMLSPGFYLGFIYLVALLKTVVGSYWWAALVIVNVAAMALIAVLVASRARRLRRESLPIPFEGQPLRCPPGGRVGQCGDEGVRRDILRRVLPHVRAGDGDAALLHGSSDRLHRVAFRKYPERCHPTKTYASPCS
ncbi:MAG: hypothetical protein WD873_06965 [Candidatus Hydrogenedentales bacterium]